MIDRILGIALDCRDAGALADFYARMLGWEKTIPWDGWAGIHAPQGLILDFQTVAEDVSPAWPWKEGAQQQMAHMDFHVDDLDATVAHASACGAKKADVQYLETSTVMLDLEGYPFCLSTTDQ